MHHLQVKAAVKRFAPMHADGKSPDEVKAAIAEFREGITEEEVEGVYLEILKIPAAELELLKTPLDDGTPAVVETPAPEPTPKPAPKPAATKKKEEEKQPVTAPAPAAVVGNPKDVPTKINGVIIRDKINYANSPVPWPGVLENPPVNEKGYVICSEYKGVVTPNEAKKTLTWRKTTLVRANVKLPVHVFQTMNRQCNKDNPVMYLPEVLSPETVKNMNSLEQV